MPRQMLAALVALQVLQPEGAASGGREVSWYVVKGDGPAAGPSNLDFVRRHRDVVTAVVPCCGCWSVVGRDDPEKRPEGQLATNKQCGPGHFGSFAAMGVRVLPCGAPGLPCLLRRCWRPDVNGGVDTVAQLVSYVAASNYSGVHSDFEMGQGAYNATHPAVAAYQEFTSALSAGLRARGKQLVIDAGAWPVQLRTQAEIAAYTLLPGRPSLMTMWPTYYATPRGCPTHCCHGCAEYFGWLRSAQAFDAQVSVGIPVVYRSGLPPAQRNVAGGKACYGEHPPAYTNKSCARGAGQGDAFGWNSSTLPPILQQVGESRLASVTVYTFPEANQGAAYTNNVTYGPWTANVAPWLLESLRRFVRG